MRIVPESESIERAALLDLHNAATPGVRAALGLASAQDGFTLVSLAAKLPPTAIVINRCIGLGVESPATLETVQSIVNSYRDAGVRRFFLQRHPDAAPPEIGHWLEDAGLVRARGWQKFSRGRAPAPDVSSDLRVEMVGSESGSAFADIVCDAFDLGDQAKPWLALLPGRPGWHVFMSFDGEQPAGCGALYIEGKAAWSDFGATAPLFRRRGSQSAVLAARIDYALSRKCERIHTCTGEDVAGDPQHSFGNILRMGFEPTYVRENWSPG